MSQVWSKLEGHVIDGAFPLLRYLGGSTHSVVFLTESAKHRRSELALKLVPAVPALAQLQLARWRASAAFIHPHLIQIFEAGHCQIGERHFLYVVTDYADQNLSQLLERRALTEEEAREMLVPVLESLTFLHGKKCVQGRLKPSNVLVVGDQIKLASDTIRPIKEEGGRASNVTSAYLPPETRDGVRTAASAVWALGVTVCEALTRKQPSSLHADDLVLPAELSSAFRGVVTRCLDRRARYRPTVKELQVWVRGAQLIASQSTSGTYKSLVGATADEGNMEVIRDSGQQPMLAASGSARTSSIRLVLAVILGAVALFLVGWAASRAL